MNEDFQLKLQAHLDGELSESEARQVEALLATDAEARALQTELRNTKAALAGFEAGITLPESREFYWSKIERAIVRAETPATVRTAVPFWRRFLIPAGAAAAVMIAALLAFQQVNPPSRAGSGVAVETVLADSGAMTYRDFSEGMTVVWLSFPPENEFADLDWVDTLQ